MSCQDAEKKREELEELTYFLHAYEEVTGEKLTIVKTGERPDFICRRANGRRTGVELTKAIVDPRAYRNDQVFGDIDWRHIFDKEPLTSFDVMLAMYRVAEDKNQKRLSGNWRYYYDTILVMQLVELPLIEVRTEIDEQMKNHFGSLGFKEIWVADYTTIESHGDIEIFAIHSQKWRGAYRRLVGKPYG